jgi:hypothetical protein
MLSLDGVSKVKDRDLACWMTRQRSLSRSNLLDPTRHEMLKKIGIDVASRNYELPWQERKTKRQKLTRESGSGSMKN